MEKNSMERIAEERRRGGGGEGEGKGRGVLESQVQTCLRGAVSEAPTRGSADTAEEEEDVILKGSQRLSNTNTPFSV